jgi:ubiquinone/menaquinone biosynthesis C-methylase UbiE
MGEPKNTQGIDNAVLVKNAFSAQAPLFDGIQHGNPMLIWMRSVIHRHIEEYLKPGDSILDINAGTGIDAIHFAQEGHAVYAMDIAEGMVNEVKKKVSSLKLEHRITVEQRSFTNAAGLAPKKFDHIFSNFGGLNCVNDLASVVEQLQAVLKPNGYVTLVVMPPVCPWEILHILQGKWKLATRRLHRKGITAHIEGHFFTTYYHSVNRVVKSFGNDFDVVKVRGVASFSPPPYMERFPKKLPRFYAFLQACDEKFSAYPPFNRWADQCIVTMKMKER